MTYTDTYHDAGTDLYVCVTGVKGEGDLTYGVLVNSAEQTVGPEVPVMSVAGNLPYCDFKPFAGPLPAPVKALLDAAPEPPPLVE